MLNKILQSSQNPEKVSLAIRGILLQVSAFIVFAGGAANYDIIGPIDSLVDKISSTIGTILLLIGQIQTIWGLIRKIKINKE